MAEISSPKRRFTDEEAAERLAFADAALGAAGHEVTDPYLNKVALRFARGEITVEDAFGVEQTAHPWELSGFMAVEREPIKRSWNDYFIPGTSVLRNKFTSPSQPYGITDPVKLQALEEGATRVRLMELSADPIPGRFDYDHMKAIHQHIFQDVYEWAGQERTAPDVPMTKAGHAYYPAGPELTAAAEAEYAKIAESNFLRGMERDVFVPELAERWGELNVVHSFREGNTRSQFAFFSQLCTQAGYRINTEAFRPGHPLREEFVLARFHSQDTGSNGPLAVVLDKAITQSAPQLTHVQPKKDPRLYVADRLAAYTKQLRAERSKGDRGTSKKADLSSEISDDKRPLGKSR